MTLADKAERPSALTPKDQECLEVLRSFGPAGATTAEWQTAFVGVKRTLFRAIGKLVAAGIVQKNGIKYVVAALVYEANADTSVTTASAYE